MDLSSGRLPARDLRVPEGQVEVSKRMVDTVAVVSLVGELDARTAPAAQEQLANLLPVRAPVLLDLAEVQYVSSAGLRTLLMVYRQAQRMGNQIELVGVSPPLRSILSATGFLRFFQIAESIVDGVEILRNSHSPDDQPT